MKGMWVGVYGSCCMNGDVSFCVACVRYLCCHGGWACVCVLVNVNTVLFIWPVLACVYLASVGLAGK